MFLLSHKQVKHSTKGILSSDKVPEFYSVFNTITSLLKQPLLLFENNSGGGEGRGSIAGVEISGSTDLSRAYPSFKKSLIERGTCM